MLILERAREFVRLMFRGPSGDRQPSVPISPADQTQSHDKAERQIAPEKENAPSVVPASTLVPKRRTREPAVDPKNEGSAVVGYIVTYVPPPARGPASSLSARKKEPRSRERPCASEKSDEIRIIGQDRYRQLTLPAEMPEDVVRASVQIILVHGFVRVGSRTAYFGTRARSQEELWRQCRASHKRENLQKHDFDHALAWTVSIGLLERRSKKYSIARDPSTQIASELLARMRAFG